MNGVSLDHAALQLRAEQAGAAGDVRVAEALKGAASGAACELALDDLMGLCWQDTRDVRILITPPGISRSVGAVAHRFLERGLTWQSLITNAVEGEYSPAWFGPCLQYANGQRDLHAGELLLVPTTTDEHRDAGQAHWYVWDGIHRSLVAAVEHLAGRRAYRPLNAIVVRPRPR
jgi:hypothetical protein